MAAWQDQFSPHQSHSPGSGKPSSAGPKRDYGLSGPVCLYWSGAYWWVSQTERFWRLSLREVGWAKERGSKVPMEDVNFWGRTIALLTGPAVLEGDWSIERAIQEGKVGELVGRKLLNIRVLSLWPKSGDYSDMQTSLLVLPWWLSGRDLACQCRRHRFDPWVGKVPWRRIWQPTSVLLPGKSRGQRSLAGSSPWGHRRVRHSLVTEHKHETFPRVL